MPNGLSGRLSKLRDFSKTERIFEGEDATTGQLKFNADFTVKSPDTGQIRVRIQQIISLGLTEICADLGSGEVSWIDILPHTTTRGICTSNTGLPDRYTETAGQIPLLVYSQKIWTPKAKSEWFDLDHVDRLALLHARADSLHPQIPVLPITLNCEDRNYQNIRISDSIPGAMAMYLNGSGYCYLGLFSDISRYMGRWSPTGNRPQWHADKSAVGQFKKNTGDAVVQDIQAVYQRADPNNIYSFEIILKKVIEALQVYRLNGGYNPVNMSSIGATVVRIFEEDVAAHEKMRQEFEQEERDARLVVIHGQRLVRATPTPLITQTIQTIQDTITQRSSQAMQPLRSIVPQDSIQQVQEREREQEPERHAQTEQAAAPSEAVQVDHNLLLIQPDLGDMTQARALRVDLLSKKDRMMEIREAARTWGPGRSGLLAIDDACTAAESGPGYVLLFSLNNQHFQALSYEHKSMVTEYIIVRDSLFDIRNRIAELDEEVRERLAQEVQVQEPQFHSWASRSNQPQHVQDWNRFMSQGSVLRATHPTARAAAGQSFTSMMAHAARAGDWEWDENNQLLPPRTGRRSAGNVGTNTAGGAAGTAGSNAGGNDDVQDVPELAQQDMDDD